jgi:Zn-dependent protease with chaperone function
MSVSMNIPFREVLVLRVSLAQAMVILDTRTLLFTERLLEIFPDDELAAICAHELAHLTESKVARYSRSVQLLTFLPWLLFNPVITLWGIIGLFALCGVTIAAPRLHKMISRKLELRADQLAKGNEGDAGTYARALTRLHENNLMPAVMAKRTTHPDLYDRIVSAGATPDFARPEPAKAIAWHGMMFAVLFGGLLSILAIRTIIAAKGGL